MKILGWLWGLASVVILAIGYYMAMYVAPTELTMGEIQRIFYWHVPINSVALVLPYVNMIASIVYLMVRRTSPVIAEKADAVAVAAAETTILFTTIGLATGMIWARPVWGIWWTWDYRLTSFFVLWLLFISYMLLRSYSSAGQTRTLAAVLSIFAGVDVPIVWFSIRWARTQHPQPVTLDPSMVPTFLTNMAGWFMWGILITAMRYTLERRRQRIDQTAALAAMEAAQ